MRGCKTHWSVERFNRILLKYWGSFLENQTFNLLSLLGTCSSCSSQSYNSLTKIAKWIKSCKKFFNIFSVIYRLYLRDILTLSPWYSDFIPVIFRLYLHNMPVFVFCSFLSSFYPCFPPSVIFWVRNSLLSRITRWQDFTRLCKTLCKL